MSEVFDGQSEYTPESPGVRVSPQVNGHVVEDTKLPPQVTEIPEELRTYTTRATKIKLRLSPVSPLLIGKVQESLQEPPVPRYKVETAVPGVVEWHDHDESTIAEDDTPEEEKQAWREYKARLREIQSLRNQRFIDLFMGKGIDFDLPDNDDWIEAQEMLGITVPPVEKRVARKIHYLQTEVLTTQDDISEVMTRIMAMTGVGNAALDEARGLFRRSLQGQEVERVDTQSGS